MDENVRGKDREDGQPAAEPAPDAAMDDAAILDGIARVARKHLDHRGTLDPEMRLVEDLELDSIRLLTLAVEVENHFRICLDEEDDRAIETVGDLVAVVRRELRDREGQDREGKDPERREGGTGDATPT